MLFKVIEFENRTITFAPNPEFEKLVKMVIYALNPSWQKYKYVINKPTGILSFGPRDIKWNELKSKVLKEEDLLGYMDVIFDRKHFLIRLSYGAGIFPCSSDFTHVKGFLSEAVGLISLNGYKGKFPFFVQRPGETDPYTRNNPFSND